MMLPIALCLAVTVASCCASYYCLKDRSYPSPAHRHGCNVTGIYFVCVALFFAALSTIVIFVVLTAGDMFYVG